MSVSKTHYLQALKAFWEHDDPIELKYNRVDTLYGSERCEANFNTLLRERVAWLLSDLSLPTDPKILEIGCGIGAVIESIAAQLPDAQIWGFDISASMVDASRLLLEERPNVSIHLTEGDRLKGVAAGSVDLVICSGVFIHILSIDVIENYIKEAFRLLKPNGCFRFNVRYRNPNLCFGDSFGGRLAKFLHRVGWYSALRKAGAREGKPRGFEGLLFSLDEIDTLTRKVGFEVDKMIFTTHPPDTKPGYVRLNCRKPAAEN